MRGLLYVIMSLITCATQIANGAEIRVTSTVAFHGVLDVLGPKFQAESGVEVKMTFGGAAAISKKVADGEAVDLVILAPPILEDLTKKGRIDGSTIKSIAQTGLGIAAKAGAPAVPMTSKEDFIAFIENAKSIGITDPASGAASSVYMAKLLPTLGLSEGVLEKVQWPPAGSFPRLVLSGEVQYWITQLSEIIPVGEVTLISKLPTSVQSVTVLSGGITTNAEQPDIAIKLLEYLKRSYETLRAKGMDPT